MKDSDLQFIIRKTDAYFCLIIVLPAPSNKSGMQKKSFDRPKYWIKLYGYNTLFYCHDNTPKQRQVYLPLIYHWALREGLWCAHYGAHNTMQWGYALVQLSLFRYKQMFQSDFGVSISTPHSTRNQISLCYRKLLDIMWRHQCLAEALCMQMRVPASGNPGLKPPSSLSAKP